MEGASKVIRSRSKSQEMLRQSNALDEFIAQEPNVSVKMPFFYRRSVLQNRAECTFGKMGSTLATDLSRTHLKD
eukprot:11191218-Lingulodinium_polyedra.AAC.1